MRWYGSTCRWGRIFEIKEKTSSLVSVRCSATARGCCECYFDVHSRMRVEDRLVQQHAAKREELAKQEQLSQPRRAPQRTTSEIDSIVQRLSPAPGYVSPGDVLTGSALPVHTSAVHERLHFRETLSRSEVPTTQLNEPSTVGPVSQVLADVRRVKGAGRHCGRPCHMDVRDSPAAPPVANNRGLYDRGQLWKSRREESVDSSRRRLKLQADAQHAEATRAAPTRTVRRTSWTNFLRRQAAWDDARTAPSCLDLAPAPHEPAQPTVPFDARRHTVACVSDAEVYAYLERCSEARA